LDEDGQGSEGLEQSCSAQISGIQSSLFKRMIFVELTNLNHFNQSNCDKGNHNNGVRNIECNFGEHLVGQQTACIADVVIAYHEEHSQSEQFNHEKGHTF